ncbi:MAG: hypothetical protein K5696_04875 [Lachnospiraceae bacterium]|nr:hypothetical protein [Lachnospiraceae bacterium]
MKRVIGKEYQPYRAHPYATQVWDNIPEADIEKYCRMIDGIYLESGIQINRRSSPVNAFFMYLLATQKDYTMEDIFRLGERHGEDIPRLFGEFMDAYSRLSLEPAAQPPKLSATQSAEYVGGLMRGAMDKIRAYRFPDTDINTLERISSPETDYLFSLLRELCVDMSQDNAVYTANSEEASDAALRAAFFKGYGSQDAYEREVDSFSEFGQALSAIRSNMFQDKRNEALMADSLHVFQSMWNEYKGKTIAEVKTPLPGARYLFSQYVSMLHSDDHISDDDRQAAVRYLSGESHDLPWQDQLDTMMVQQVAAAGGTLDQAYRNGVTRMNYVDFESFNTERVDMRAVSDTEDKSTLTPDQKRGLDIIWGNTMGWLLGSTVYQAFAQQGKTPYDAITIDGNSVSQLYGQRYAGLSQFDRERAYQAEILAACSDPSKKVEIAQPEMDSTMMSGVITDKRSQIRYTPLEIALPAGRNGKDLDLPAFGREFLRDPAAAAARPEFDAIPQLQSALEKFLSSDKQFLETKGKNLFDCFRINGETVNAYYDRALAARFPGASADDALKQKTALLYAARAIPGNQVTYSAPRHTAGKDLEFCEPLFVGISREFSKVTPGQRSEIEEAQKSGELQKIAAMHPYDMNERQRELFFSIPDEFLNQHPQIDAIGFYERKHLAILMNNPIPRTWNADTLSDKPVLRREVLDRIKEMGANGALIRDEVAQYRTAHRDELVRRRDRLEAAVPGGQRKSEIMGLDTRDLEHMIDIPGTAGTEEEKRQYIRQWIDRYMDVPDGRKECLDRFYDKIDRMDHMTYDLSCLTTQGDRTPVQPDGLTKSEHDFIEALRRGRMAQARGVKAEENPEYIRKRYSSDRALALFEAGADRDITGSNRYLEAVLGAHDLSIDTLKPLAGLIVAPSSRVLRTACDEGEKYYERRLAAWRGETALTHTDLKLEVPEDYRGQEQQYLTTLDGALDRAGSGKPLTADECRLFSGLYDDTVGKLYLGNKAQSERRSMFGMNDLDMLFVDGKPLREFVGDKYGNSGNATGAAAADMEERMKAEFILAAMSGKHRTERAEIGVGKTGEYEVNVVPLHMDSHVMDSAEHHNIFRRMFNFGATKITSRAAAQDALWSADPDMAGRHEQIKSSLGGKMLASFTAKEKARMAAHRTVAKKHISREDFFASGTGSAPEKTATRKRSHSAAITPAEAQRAAAGSEELQRPKKERPGKRML